MRGFFFMSGRLLFLGLVLALLNVQAFAQIGLVLQLPPTANIDNVAAHAGGVVVDAIPEAGLFLLSVSAVPQNLSDSDRVWAEVNQGTTLPSATSTTLRPVTSTTLRPATSTIRAQVIWMTLPRATWTVTRLKFTV